MHIHLLLQPSFRTIEDIYDVLIETEKGGKEKVRIYDTAGLVSNCTAFYHIIFYLD